MSDEETKEIVQLQDSLIRRLADLGVVGVAGQNLARQLAHVAALGKSFAERTLPLLLSLDVEHQTMLLQVLLAMTCDLDELRDALQDLAPDLAELIESLRDEKGL